MKHLQNFVALLAGALPVLSFIIPEERVANQVFRTQGRVESDPSQLEEFRRKFEKLEENFEGKLNDFIDQVGKFEENLGASKVEDTVTVSGAAALDDGFDAFYGLKTEQPFSDTYEYFDGQAWFSQAEDPLFGDFPYEELTSESHRKHHEGDHDHHGHDGHGHDGHGHDGHGHHGHGKCPHMPPRDPHGPHTDSTLYDIIVNSKHTTKLAELIKLDDDLVNLLKDPEANITIFAPGDEAFKRIPKKDPKDVPKDLLKRVLTYHVVPGVHGSYDLIHHNTLRTELSEDELGKDLRQRLRVGFGFHGPTVNFYSKITIVDVYAKNGVIHGVNALLLPPPTALGIIEVLPTAFSTSEAAFFRVGLTDELKKHGKGLTVFVPTNKVWEKLGYKVNAFLFSEHGKECLSAIMKYHIVPGHTLYSDAYVTPEHKTSNEKDPDGLPYGYQHISLPTLLEDRYISADITRYGKFTSFRVNGLSRIFISDGIAKNGVIQVPDHVLIPPHSEGEHPPKEAGEGEEEEDREMTVEELKARLAPYVNAQSEL